MRTVDCSTPAFEIMDIPTEADASWTDRPHPIQAATMAPDPVSTAQPTLTQSPTDIETSSVRRGRPLKSSLHFFSGLGAQRQDQAVRNPVSPVEVGRQPFQPLAGRGSPQQHRVAAAARRRAVPVGREVHPALSRGPKVVIDVALGMSVSPSSATAVGAGRCPPLFQCSTRFRQSGDWLLGHTDRAVTGRLPVLYKDPMGELLAAAVRGLVVSAVFLVQVLDLQELWERQQRRKRLASLATGETVDIYCVLTDSPELRMHPDDAPHVLEALGDDSGSLY
jgi:hypothetical protein